MAGTYNGVTALVVCRGGGGDIVFEGNVKFAALPAVGDTVLIDDAHRVVRNVRWTVHKHQRNGQTSYVANAPLIQID